MSWDSCLTLLGIINSKGVFLSLLPLRDIKVQHLAGCSWHHVFAVVQVLTSCRLINARRTRAIAALSRLQNSDETQPSEFAIIVTRRSDCSRRLFPIPMNLLPTLIPRAYARFQIEQVGLSYMRDES